MEIEKIIRIIEEYKAHFELYLSRYRKTESGFYMNAGDDPVYRQEIREVIDFLQDNIKDLSYSQQVMDHFNWGINNYIGCPSYKSVENIIGILGAIITRLKRNPDLIKKNEPRETVENVGIEEATEGPTGEDIKKNVFVVHGRNIEAMDAMFAFLRSLGLNPIEWEEAVSYTGKGSPSISEILDAAFKKAQAVVVIITGDDIAKLSTNFLTDRDQEWERNFTPQARPNVLFEAGLAFGSHPNRTILVELGKNRFFSDIAGRHIIKMSDRPNARQELVSRLKTVGCDFDHTHKTNWLSVGNFEKALNESAKAISEEISNISKCNTSDVKKTIECSELTKEEIYLLKLFSEAEDAGRTGRTGLTAQDIAPSNGMATSTKVEYFLGELKAQNYLRASVTAGKIKYSLTHKGREYLAKQNLI